MRLVLEITPHLSVTISLERTVILVFVKEGNIVLGHRVYDWTEFRLNLEFFCAAIKSKERELS